MSTVTEPEPESGSGTVGTPEDGRPGRAVAVAVGLALAALVASLVGGVVLALPLVVFGADVGSVPVLLALTVVGQLGFLLIGYLYVRRTGLPVRMAIPDRRDVGYLVGGVVVALALAVTLSLVLAVLDLLPGSVIADTGMADPAFFVGLAVLSVVLVGPVEEFLFRGVIQGRLRRAFGPVGAVVGASLLFGAMHLANYTGAVVPVIAGASLVATVSLVFGALYERTGNLVVPMVAHGAYNVALFALALFGM